MVCCIHEYFNIVHVHVMVLLKMFVSFPFGLSMLLVTLKGTLNVWFLKVLTAKMRIY